MAKIEHTQAGQAAQASREPERTAPTGKEAPGFDANSKKLKEHLAKTPEGKAALEKTEAAHREMVDKHTEKHAESTAEKPAEKSAEKKELPKGETPPQPAQATKLESPVHTEAPKETAKTKAPITLQEIAKAAAKLLSDKTTGVVEVKTVGVNTTYSVTVNDTNSKFAGCKISVTETAKGFVIAIEGGDDTARKEIDPAKLANQLVERFAAAGQQIPMPKVEVQPPAPERQGREGREDQGKGGQQGGGQQQKKKDEDQ